MTTTCWHVGHNLAGYLPESDVECYLTREDAVEGFEAIATEYADGDDEQHDMSLPDAYGTEADVPDDAYGSMRAVVDSILKDDGPDAPGHAGKDYAMTVEDNGYRRIVFFMIKQEPECDHEGCEHD